MLSKDIPETLSATPSPTVKEKGPPVIVPPSTTVSVSPPLAQMISKSSIEAHGPVYPEAPVIVNLTYLTFWASKVLLIVLPPEVFPVASVKVLNPAVAEDVDPSTKN